jgi:hypothetical protein
MNNNSSISIRRNPSSPVEDNDVAVRTRTALDQSEENAGAVRTRTASDQSEDPRHNMPNYMWIATHSRQRLPITR